MPERASHAPFVVGVPLALPFPLLLLPLLVVLLLPDMDPVSSAVGEAINKYLLVWRDLGVCVRSHHVCM